MLRKMLESIILWVWQNIFGIFIGHTYRATGELAKEVARVFGFPQFNKAAIKKAVVAYLLRWVNSYIFPLCLYFNIQLCVSFQWDWSRRSRTQVNIIRTLIHHKKFHQFPQIFSFKELNTCPSFLNCKFNSINILKSHETIIWSFFIWCRAIGTVQKRIDVSRDEVQISDLNGR